MLFFSTRSRDALRRAVHAAIAAHRPVVLRHLLLTHGEAAFVTALSDCSSRVVADALSMLDAPQRQSVERRLPPKRSNAAVGGHWLACGKSA